MSIRIQDNHMALQSQRHFASSLQETARATERLSTGYRINNAGDDAAGLHISTNLQSKVRGSRVAMGNIQDGINMLNIIDANHNRAFDSIHRIRELVVQAANDTNDSSQRAAIQEEVDALGLEISRMYSAASYGGMHLFATLDPVTLANVSSDFLSDSEIYIQLGSASTDALDIDNPTDINNSRFIEGPLHPSNGLIDVSTHANAANSLIQIDSVLTTASSRLKNVGIATNNLEKAYSNLQIELENTAATNSRLQDADVAAESLNLIQSQIKQNSAAAMLTQANGQNAQIALSLMGA